MSSDKEDGGYKGGFELDSPIGKVKADASLPPSAGKSFARAVEMAFSGLFPTTFDLAKNRTLKARIDEAVTNKMVQAIDSIDHREIYAALLNYRLREDATMLEGRAEILAIAAEQLATPGRGATNEGDAHTISDDFLSHFWRTADRVSNAEMRIIFSRILSGEIARPGSFSASTLSLVATLHPRDASNFELMCRMALSNGSHSFVVVNATHADRPHLESNTVTSGTNIGEYLVDFGIDVNDALELVSVGLCRGIGEDEHMRFDRLFSSGPYELAGRNVAFNPGPKALNNDRPSVGIISLTNTGNELRSVISLEPLSAYESKLVEVLKTADIDLIFE